MNQRVRPYHTVIIGFGVFWALFSIASGVAPLVFGWFDDSPVQREVFENILWARGSWPSHPASGVVRVRRLAVRPQVKELGAGRTGRPGDDNQDIGRRLKGRLPPGRGVYMQTLLRPGCGPHALAHLLLLPDPVRGHGGLSDPRPGAGRMEVPSWPDLSGVFVRRRCRRPRLRHRHRMGVAAALRPTPVPNSREVQARASR